MSFDSFVTIASGLWPLAPAVLVLMFIQRRSLSNWCSMALNKRLQSTPRLENQIACLSQVPTLYIGYVGYAVSTQSALDYLTFALASLICLVAIRISFGLRLRLVELRTVEQSNGSRQVSKRFWQRRNKKVERTNVR